VIGGCTGIGVATHAALLCFHGGRILVKRKPIFLQKEQFLLLFIFDYKNANKIQLKTEVKLLSFW
jgi:hypothetical protein